MKESISLANEAGIITDFEKASRVSELSEVTFQHFCTGEVPTEINAP
jgi:hypothetical protein